LQTETNISITGTSIKTPTTVATAAPQDSSKSNQIQRLNQSQGQLHLPFKKHQKYFYLLHFLKNSPDTIG